MGTPSVKRGSILFPGGKTMSRLETMTKEIQKDIPEFVELVPPSERSEGLYRRIRHIQKTGECCGMPMTIEELKEIIALAGRETVNDAICYLCRVLDRKHIARTLKTAQNRLNLDSRVRDIMRYVKLEAEWQIKLLSDLITGKYSMDDIMTACEIANRKDKPDRYLIKIFRNGIRFKRFYC